MFTEAFSFSVKVGDIFLLVSHFLADFAAVLITSPTNTDRVDLLQVNGDIRTFSVTERTGWDGRGEVMGFLSAANTIVEVLLDGSSVVDVFAVNSARRKRVEVSERKMTEGDRSLFRKTKRLEFESWLDHQVFDLVKKKLVDQERIMRARWVLTWKSSGKAKARLCVLGFEDPDLTEVPRDIPTLSTASEALIMQWVASHKYRLI